MHYSVIGLFINNYPNGHSVLSAFDESSAACISDMVRQISNGRYLDAIRMAVKFILHVEVFFETIDDHEYYSARMNLKGMLCLHCGV